MKQEVTRQRKPEGWSLDEVDYKAEAQKEVITGDDGRIEGKNLSPPNEGVFIHGLYLEGSMWHKQEKRFEEQVGKDLYFNFPILHVSAESTAVVTDKVGPGSKKETAKDKENTHYFCPVYKYKMRNDRYLIFRAWLKADGAAGAIKYSHQVKPPQNWKLKGVALLCSKEWAL